MQAGWLIANPEAGQKAGLATRAAGPEEARAALERAGLAVDVHLTEYAGHATELARAAAKAGGELVIATGRQDGAGSRCRPARHTSCARHPATQ
ncbi:MAG: hypothetical protein C4289_01570 [Chloroflexota bacterium]